MMAHKWFIYVSVLVIFEHIDAKRPSVRQEATRQVTMRHRHEPTHQAPRHFPLLKPHSNSRSKLDKNLEEQRLGQDYIEQYQDMMKATQESFENFDERDDKRLRRLIGDDDLGLMAEAGGVGGRRRGRSGGRLLSEHSAAVGLRRARNKIARRNKLHAQSITSHKKHSRANYIQYSDHSS